MAISFEALINKISEVAVQAQHVMDAQAEERLQDLFDREGDALVLKKIYIKLFDDIGLDTPRLILRNLASLQINTMRMKLDTEIDLGSMETPNEISATLKQGLRENSTEMEIEVEFGSVEPPEGIWLMKDALNTKFSHDLGGTDG